MKKIIYHLNLVLILIIFSTSTIFSQESSLKSEETNQYRKKSDSLIQVQKENSDLAIQLKNEKVDSVIQLKNTVMENRKYLADSEKLQNKNELDSAIAERVKEMNGIKEQSQTQISNKKQVVESVMEQKRNMFNLKLSELDSLITQYKTMKEDSSKHDESALSTMKSSIEQKREKVDSMYNDNVASCNKYQKEIDSLCSKEKEDVESLLKKKQEKIDSLLGVNSQVKFKITEKYANMDTAKNANKKLLSDVVEEIILKDSNKICVKFNADLSEPKNIKTLFQIKLQDSSNTLKSMNISASIEISDVIWSAEKSDVIQFIIDTQIESAEEIELDFAGEVITSGEEILIQEISTMVKNNSLNKEILVYPNPATNYITINNLTEMNTILIYNITGTIVRNITGSDLTTTISLNGLNSGIYFIRIYENSSQIYMNKFIKK